MTKQDLTMGLPAFDDYSLPPDQMKVMDLYRCFSLSSSSRVMGYGSPTVEDVDSHEGNKQ